jgi:hypothetical protein
MNWRHIQRYLDTADERLTSNLCHHVKICWGKEAITGADAAKSHHVACEIVEKSLRMLDGSITAMFKCIKGKGSVTYLHRPHTKTESWYVMVEPYLSCIHMLIFITSMEIIQWVAESMHPFKIVKDQGFQCLMKTGRPGYYIPSPETVSQDTKKVFVHVRRRIAMMLQIIHWP